MPDKDPLAGTSRPRYLSSVASVQLGTSSVVPAAPSSVNPTIVTNALGDRVRAPGDVVEFTGKSSYDFLTAEGAAKGSAGEKPPKWFSTQFNLSPLPKSMVTEMEGYQRRMRKTLGVASQVIAIIEVLYQIIDALQSDFNNWYKLLKAVLVELLKQLQEIIVSLASTGIYLLPVLPDFKRGVKGAVKPGGFDAVLSKVTQKLTDPMDPNRPTFSDNDAVGGILAVLTSGTNIGDLINNFNALGEFIKGFSIEGPGLGELSAVAGLYSKGITSGASTVAQKFPGIKITWRPPVGLYKANTFHVRRCQLAGGMPMKIKITGTEEWVPQVDAQGNVLTYFGDTTFNGGNPLKIKSSRISGMKFTDFEVEQGKTYFYKVIPVISGAEQEGVSKEVSASVNVCIPDNEFMQFLETPDGLRVGPNMGEKPDWQNQSLKALIGPALDEMFKSLVRMVGTIASLADTSTDAFSDLLALMKRWVAKLKLLLEKIAAVLQALAKLKFSGGAAIVRIDPDFKKGGGITRLVRMINSASMSEGMRTDMKENSGLCSIAAAVFIVVGAPSSSTFTSVGIPSDMSQELLDAGSMGATTDAAKTAWDMVSSLFGDSGKQDAAVAAQTPAITGA